LPWSRGGHDPQPMLLSPGALLRLPLGVVPRHRTPHPTSSIDRSQRRTLMDVPPAAVGARGPSCPGPLVALHKALKDVGPGDLLELLATDPGSRSDVPSWSK